MKIKVPYHISNGGDGSASIELHPTREAADKADEEMEECWGEQCSGTLEIEIEDGKVFYQSYEPVDPNEPYGLHHHVRVEIPQ